MCSLFAKAIFFTFIPSNKVIIYLSLKSERFYELILLLLITLILYMNVFIRIEIAGGHSVFIFFFFFYFFFFFFYNFTRYPQISAACFV